MSGHLDVESRRHPIPISVYSYVMEAGEAAVIQELREIALGVARNLPAAHWLTRPWRSVVFKRLVDRFLKELYAVDVKGYQLEDFDALENALNIAIKTIELHLLAHDQSEHPAHRHYFAIIEKLRTAREGVIRGYAPDPARRPSEEEIERRALAKLEAMFAK